MKKITEEKKVCATILDENGFEIYMICDLQKVVTEWHRDEDDIRTFDEWHYEIDHIYDIVLQSGPIMVSIFDKVIKNNEMTTKIEEAILDDAEQIWNSN